VDYVEIDVRTSRDGVMYLFHNPDVDRTTNGMGLFDELTSTIIDTLDIGSRFSPEYANERIPRLDAFLHWIKGKAKVYFDVKDADHQKLIDLVYQTGFAQECFFWSGDNKWTLKFRDMAPELPVKINVRNTQETRMAFDRYEMDIIEVDLKNMTVDLQKTCRDLGIKIMIYHQQKDPDAFRQVINWNVDMINLNHADAFIEVAQKMGVR
jgi:glycerophosphoryl diester phosphodiesterase